MGSGTREMRQWSAACTTLRPEPTDDRHTQRLWAEYEEALARQEYGSAQDIIREIRDRRAGVA